MAAVVEEIMNRELFSFTPGEKPDRALRYLFLLGISGAPILDVERRPVGMISLRDLTRPGASIDSVARCMSTPVATIPSASRIAEAGRLLAETGYHRLVAVDEGGRAVGLVSTLDVIRGILGMPAFHPPTFPHYDAATGVNWRQDEQLTFDRVEAAPEGPGVFVLIHGGASEPERVVWAEAVPNVRRRLIDLLTQRLLPRHLVTPLAQGKLRFRSASAPDAEVQGKALRAIAQAT
jgi:hypothetical protein